MILPNNQMMQNKVVMRLRLTLNLSDIEQVNVSVREIAEDNPATINIRKNKAPNNLFNAGS